MLRFLNEKEALPQNTKPNRTRMPQKPHARALAECKCKLQPAIYIFHSHRIKIICISFFYATRNVVFFDCFRSLTYVTHRWLIWSQKHARCTRAHEMEKLFAKNSNLWHSILSHHLCRSQNLSHLSSSINGGASGQALWLVLDACWLIDFYGFYAFISSIFTLFLTKNFLFLIQFNFRRKSYSNVENANKLSKPKARSCFTTSAWLHFGWQAKGCAASTAWLNQGFFVNLSILIQNFNRIDATNNGPKLMNKLCSNMWNSAWIFATRLWPKMGFTSTSSSHNKFIRENFIKPKSNPGCRQIIGNCTRAIHSSGRAKDTGSSKTFHWEDWGDWWFGCGWCTREVRP